MNRQLYFPKGENWWTQVQRVYCLGGKEALPSSLLPILDFFQISWQAKLETLLGLCNFSVNYQFDNILDV